MTSVSWPVLHPIHWHTGVRILFTNTWSEDLSADQSYILSTGTLKWGSYPLTHWSEDLIHWHTEVRILSLWHTEVRILSTETLKSWSYPLTHGVQDHIYWHTEVRILSTDTLKSGSYPLTHWSEDPTHWHTEFRIISTDTLQSGSLSTDTLKWESYPLTHWSEDPTHWHTGQDPIHWCTDCSVWGRQQVAQNVLVISKLKTKDLKQESEAPSFRRKAQKRKVRQPAQHWRCCHLA